MSNAVPWRQREVILADTFTLALELLRSRAENPGMVPGFRMLEHLAETWDSIDQADPLEDAIRSKKHVLLVDALWLTTVLLQKEGAADLPGVITLNKLLQDGSSYFGVEAQVCALAERTFQVIIAA